MRVFRALFWKEYRQVAALSVAMLILGVFIMLWSGIFSHAIPNSVAYSGIAFAVTAMFGASVAAIMFSREHEEKTFVFLRSLPVSPAQLAKVKFAVIATGTLVLLIVLLGVGSIFGSVFGNDSNDFATAVKLFGVACMEGICWGIFFSSRSRKQITALLGTFICASFGAYAMSVVHVIAFNNGTNVLGPTEYADAFLFRLLLAIPFGIIGISTALGWLKISAFASGSAGANSGVDMADPAAFRPASPKNPKRGEFRALLRHNFAQSKSTYLYMLGFELLLGLWVAGNIVMGRGLDEIKTSGDYFLVLATAIISAVVFSATVFSGDQNHSRASMLSELGVSPGKIWFSRIVPAAVVYFIPLLAMQAYSCYRDRSLYGTLFEEMLDSWGYHLNHPLVFPVIYIACFCIGQMLSMFVRSMVVSISITGIFVTLLGFWTLMVSSEPELSPLWTVVPGLIACLIASRVYSERWLRKGRGFRALRPALSILGGATLAILIAIPFLRVYSVPVIDLGYRVRDVYVLGHTREDGDYLMEREKRNVERLRDKIGMHEPAAGKEIEIWDEIRDSLADPWKSSRYHANSGNRYYSYYFHPYSDNEKKTLVSAEEVKDQIKAQEYILEHPIPSFHRVSRLFESEYRSVYYSRVPNDYDFHRNQLEMCVYRFLPWERARALRLLRNQFQLKAKLADGIDMAIYHGIGDPIAITGADWEQDRELFAGRKNYSGMYFLSDNWGYEARPGNVYHEEWRRRINLIHAAIFLWYIERGELPETLYDVKGVYLKEIPKTPYYMTDFMYDPHPDGTELPNQVKNNTHKPGMPYFYAKEYGHLIDLDFVNRPETAAESE